MDKVSKLLKKLTDSERKVLKKLLTQINQSGLVGLDVKKLVGREDIFRVRKGDLRVILRLKKGKYFILTIERRSEKTYKNI
jgi:mRNA-degrading endonuclease RelE of RelBE toxin-antitoxin system